MASVAKHSQSHITVKSTLPGTDLLSLSRSIEGTKPGGLRGGPSRLVLDVETENGQAFSIVSWGGRKWLSFDVAVTSAAGKSTLRTDIKDFGSTQETLFFIPVGPKQIGGYYMYRHFMDELASRVRAQDESAEIRIVEA